MSVLCANVRFNVHNLLMVDPVGSMYPLDWDDGGPNDIDAHLRKLLSSDNALASYTLGRDLYQGRGLEKQYVHGTMDEGCDFVLLDEKEAEERGLQFSMGRKRELVGSKLEPTMFQCTATVDVEMRRVMRRSQSGCNDAESDALDASFKRTSLPLPTQALLVAGQLPISTIGHTFGEKAFALCIPGSPTYVSAEILAILKPENDVNEEWRIPIQRVINMRQADVSRRGGAEKVRKQLESAAGILKACEEDFPAAAEIAEEVLAAKQDFRVKNVRGQKRKIQ